MNGAQLRDAAMDQALAHADAANEDWSERAYRMVLWMAATVPEFTCEDVRDAAESMGLPKPPTTRAWGGIMRRAAIAGRISPTGKYTPIRAASNHARPVAVWRRAA